jgi:heme/copper-type cytochrome/quinol oxidase subunit 4
MSEDLKAEIHNQAEPLLPIEKKLIGWSLGIGLALLAVLLLVSRLFPAS